METIINIGNHNIVLEPPNIDPKMKCSVIGCYNVKKARGLCDKHLARFYRHGNTNKPIHKGNNIINKYDDYAEVCIKENIKILIDLEDIEKVFHFPLYHRKNNSLRVLMKVWCSPHSGGIVWSGRAVEP